jgi:hypothetical protein
VIQPARPERGLQPAPRPFVGDEVTSLTLIPGKKLETPHVVFYEPLTTLPHAR